MRVLYSSSDLRQQTELIKKLLDRGIPCGLFKKDDDSQLSLWIQHDYNFPQAVDVLANQNRTRPLPGWANAFDEGCLRSDDEAKDLDTTLSTDESDKVSNTALSTDKLSLGEVAGA